MHQALSKMKVAVTGGNGYLGKYVADYFQAEKLSRRTGFDVTQKNIEDRLKDYKVIIHMAALVDKSEKNPEEVFRVNVEGTKNIASALKPGQILIVLSTKEIYTSSDAYSYSKRIAEEYANYFSKKIGFRCGIFRLATIYAPPTNGATFVNYFVDAIKNKKELQLLMKGGQIRDFLYVDDLSRAFEKFIKSGIQNATYDIGGGKENATTLEGFVRLIGDILQIEPIIAYSDKPIIGQAHYVTNLDKIKKELGWSPSVTIEEGIKKIEKYDLDILSKS